MTTLSNLSGDLVGEILSRVPLTHLRVVRSTCKNWNDLSKNQIFGKSATARKQFLGFMLMDCRVCSMKLDLQGIRNADNIVDPSIKELSIINQVGIIKQLFYCDGLLLCLTKNRQRLVVWNPYLGQTRRIQLKDKSLPGGKYVLGYDNNRNHKILRFFDGSDVKYFSFSFEIYDFSSDSWKDLDVNPDCDKIYYQKAVSLMGNTYFVVSRAEGHTSVSFLLCFDFRAERFGPRLLLPFDRSWYHRVAVSCVRDEQLAVSYTHYDTIIEIWITTKIDPNAVSWSKFLKFDKTLLPTDRLFTWDDVGSFFIDEEKKVALVSYKPCKACPYQTAYIIGEDGYFRSVNIGAPEPEQEPEQDYRYYYYNEVVFFPYVPSLVQLKGEKDIIT